MPSPRNAPCPCGSGRRYKECHGSIPDTRQAMRAAAEDPNVVVELQRALEAHQAGKLIAAAAAYEAVLAASPENFDALHMLGVVKLQQGLFDEAEVLIAAALRLRPGFGSACANLATVRRNRQFASEEDAICRALLPRLGHLCIDPPPLLLANAGSGIAVEVVFAGRPEDAVLAQQVAAAALLRGATVAARTLVEPGPPGWKSTNSAALASIADQPVVVVGVNVALGDWPLVARPRSTMLVLTQDDPCALHDRLREISGQGRRRVGLASPDAALIAAIPLPISRFASPADS